MVNNTYLWFCYFMEYSGWSYIFSLYFCMSLFFIHSVSVRFFLSLLDWVFKRHGYHLLLPVSPVRIYSTDSSCLTGHCYETDIFPPSNWLKLAIFIFSIILLYAESVTLICSMVHKEKRSLELTTIWNSKEMGHPKGSKQCGNFMHKARLCFVSGHLLLVTSTNFLFPTIMNLILFRVALKNL